MMDGTALGRLGRYLQRRADQGKSKSIFCLLGRTSVFSGVVVTFL
jgi:hypothetical protein